MNLIAPYYKSVLAGLLGFLGGIQTGLLKDGLDAAEILGAVITGLVATGFVYVVPNKGATSPQIVVDEIRKRVPDETASVITETVQDVARGVLKDVK
jgi:hypothetical protein